MRPPEVGAPVGNRLVGWPCTYGSSIRKARSGPAGSTQTRPPRVKIVSPGSPITRLMKVVSAVSPVRASSWGTVHTRSEEHTSELQSRQYLVCPLLLGKKKKTSRNVD